MAISVINVAAVAEYVGKAGDVWAAVRTLDVPRFNAVLVAYRCTAILVDHR